MLIFSQIHNWQNDPAVKQVLVFPNESVRETFETEFAERAEREGWWYASDSNAGAIYKLRSVKNSDESYAPVIRCGKGGDLLWEGKAESSERFALSAAVIELYRSIMEVPEELMDKNPEDPIVQFIERTANQTFDKLFDTKSGNYEFQNNS